MADTFAANTSALSKTSDKLSKASSNFNSSSSLSKKENFKEKQIEAKTNNSSSKSSNKTNINTSSSSVNKATEKINTINNNISNKYDSTTKSLNNYVEKVNTTETKIANDSKSKLDSSNINISKMTSSNTNKTSTSSSSTSKTSTSTSSKKETFKEHQLENRTNFNNKKVSLPKKNTTISSTNNSNGSLKDISKKVNDLSVKENFKEQQLENRTNFNNKIVNLPEKENKATNNTKTSTKSEEYGLMYGLGRVGGISTIDAVNQAKWLNDYITNKYRTTITYKDVFKEQQLENVTHLSTKKVNLPNKNSENSIIKTALKTVEQVTNAGITAIAVAAWPIRKLGSLMMGETKEEFQKNEEQVKSNIKDLFTNTTTDYLYDNNMLLNGYDLANAGVSFAHGSMSSIESLNTTAINAIAVAAWPLRKLGSLMLGQTNEEFQKSEEQVKANLMDLAINTTTNELSNNFYQDTKAGKKIAKNSNHFEGTKAVAEGAGYITTSIMLGGMLGKGIGVTGKALSATKSSVFGAAQFSKNSAAAWQDGATYEEGLLYSTVKSLWDAGSMYAGTEMNGYTPFKTGSPWKSVANSMVHVGFDAADGAISAGVDPLFQLIYTPSEEKLKEMGYKGTVESYNNLSILEKYALNFNANGGLDNVLKTAGFSGAMSLASEIPSMSKEIFDYNKGTSLSNEIRKNTIELDKAIKNNDEVAIKSLSAKNLELQNSYNALNKNQRYYYALDTLKGNIKNGNINPNLINSFLNSNDTENLFNNLSKDNKILLANAMNDNQAKQFLDKVGTETKKTFLKYNLDFDSSLKVINATAGDINFIHRGKNIQSRAYGEIDAFFMQGGSEYGNNQNGLTNIINDATVTTKKYRLNDLNYQFDDNLLKQSCIDIMRYYGYDESYSREYAEKFVKGFKQQFANGKTCDEKVMTIFSSYFSRANHGDYNAGFDELSKLFDVTESTKLLDGEGKRLFNKLTDMGMSKYEARQYMENINEAGVCTYATKVNQILAKFRDNPEEFKKHFGFDMYIDTPNGRQLNGDELMLDMHTWVNTHYLNPMDGNRKKLLKKNIFGRLGLKNFDTDYQVYMEKSSGLKIFDEYLSTKGLILESPMKEEIFFANPNGKFTDFVKQEMDKGNLIDLGIYSPDNIDEMKKVCIEKFGYEVDLVKKPYHMIDLDTGEIICDTSEWDSGGHSMFVTGVIEDEGVIVATWGHRALIREADFQQNYCEISRVRIKTFKESFEN